jgi:hypothetical protein
MAFKLRRSKSEMEQGCHPSSGVESNDHHLPLTVKRSLPNLYFVACATNPSGETIIKSIRAKTTWKVALSLTKGREEHPNLGMSLLL